MNLHKVQTMTMALIMMNCIGTKSQWQIRLYKNKMLVLQRKENPVFSKQDLPSNRIIKTIKKCKNVTGSHN